MVSPDQVKESVRRNVKWICYGIGAIALGVVGYGFFVSIIETTIAAFVALGVVGVVYAATPAMMDWLGDMRWKAAIAVAEANPIETMLSIEEEKAQELKSQQAAVEEVDTQYRNVCTEVEKLRKTDPDDVPQFLEARDKLKEGLDEMQQEYDEADAALKEFTKQRQHAQRLWSAAQAINKALNVAGAARSNVFRDIKQQVAFDTVTSNLNRQFARLDTTIKRRKGLLPTPTANVVEGTVVQPLALPEAMPVINNINQVKKGKVNG